MDIMQIGTVACLVAFPPMASALAMYADCAFTESASVVIPFNGNDPVFTQKVESLALQIEDETFEDNRAVLVLANDRSELRLVSAPFATSYVESAIASTVTAITIYWNGQMPAGDFPASYVRTASSVPPYDATGFAVPSLMVGRCRITRG